VERRGDKKATAATLHSNYDWALHAQPLLRAEAGMTGRLTHPPPSGDGPTGHRHLTLSAQLCSFLSHGREIQFHSDKPALARLERLCADTGTITAHLVSAPTPAPPRLFASAK